MHEIVTLAGVGVPIFSVKVLVRLFYGVLGTPGQISPKFWGPFGNHFGSLGDLGWKGIVALSWPPQNVGFRKLA